jgi:DNA polymerase epsilon subunit 1
LDLCRDADVLPGPSTSAADDPAQQRVTPKWKCQTCNAAFDKLRIEERLVARVQRFVVAWTTQDLKCGKCGRLRSNEFMEHCACAGEWVGTVKRDEVVKEVSVMKTVAEWYGLGMLEGVCEEVLDGV